MNDSATGTTPQSVAIDLVTNALKDAGIEIDSLPEQLIAIAAAQNISIEQLLWWINDRPKGKEFTAYAWRERCRKFRVATAALEAASPAELSRWPLCSVCCSVQIIQKNGVRTCPNGCKGV
jgi:hypothetical protein